MGQVASLLFGNALYREVDLCNLEIILPSICNTGSVCLEKFTVFIPLLVVVVVCWDCWADDGVTSYECLSDSVQ